MDQSAITFTNKLLETARRANSLLCVGLDPNLERLPAAVLDSYQNDADRVLHFCRGVVEATQQHCCAYKPNLGFFEALGASGLDVFQQLLDYIPDNKIVIADAKRGDIHSTASHYRKAYFDVFDVDAVTLNPLMGFETLDPFLDAPDKAIFVLALTSNPGASDLLLQPLQNGNSVSAHIAQRLAGLQRDSETHLGMVMGATQAQRMQDVLRRHPRAHLLVPGVGTQGGSVDELIDTLSGHQGIPIVTSSRSIIFAGGDHDDWQQAVGETALKYKQQLKSLTERYV